MIYYFYIGLFFGILSIVLQLTDYRYKNDMFNLGCTFIFNFLAWPVSMCLAFYRIKKALDE